MDHVGWRAPGAAPDEFRSSICAQQNASQAIRFGQVNTFHRDCGLSINKVACLYTSFAEMSTPASDSSNRLLFSAENRVAITLKTPCSYPQAL
jgi:hypothetical protein